MNFNLSRNEWITVLLADATALIHLVLAFASGIDIIFIGNGLGYFALAAAYFMLPQTRAFRPQIKWAFIGYTALTVVLYFVMNPDPMGSVLGLITKVIEVALIVMLFIIPVPDN